ncbi:MAG TPA: tetratricopeptide repeat protein, partial [Spirochaetota bacterium]|nr:tetratricopeptide repeat protein [Spirochaetota bacterium]
MGYVVIQIFLGILLIGGGAIFLILLITKVLSPQKTHKLITLVKAGNYKQAIKVAKEIIAKDPNNVEARYYLGESYYNEGRYELALIEYKSSDKIGVYTKNMK